MSSYPKIEVGCPEVEVGCGVSTSDGSFEAGVASATEASASLTTHLPSVVFVCASERHNLEEVLRGVHAVFRGVPVMGTTTAGEICNTSYERSVVVSTIASPHVLVRCVV